jgi:Polyketide cyclase / dehydrase and lipid transport
MKATITETIPGAGPDALFEQIATLDRYPPWMRLVHKVSPLPPDDRDRLAWWVELRARVGPFTRSKQLRMVRTRFVPNELVKFERIQPDDRDHAEWILTGEVNATHGGSELTMHLEYTGELWSMRVLGKILDDEVRRSTAALSRLLNAQPTR